MRMRFRQRVVFLALMLAGAAVLADDLPADRSDRLSFSAFGTLGLARSDNDSKQYVRDLSQKAGLTRQWSSEVDSVIGAQANVRLAPGTEAVIQALSRYRHDGSYRPEISWAFLKHQFAPDLQVRVGRLGTEFYMQSDSRLVGYGNTTIRPAPDFFDSLIFTYFDGIDISGGRAIGDDLLRAKVYYGRSPETVPFYGDISWNVSGSRLAGAQVDYSHGPWQLRLSHNQVRFSCDELPLDRLADPVLAANGLGALVPFPITRAMPELSTVGTTSRFDAIGLIYDQGPLRVHAMLGRIDHENAAYEDSRAGFIVGSYRFGSFSPYLGYSKTRSRASKVTTVPNTVLGPLPVLTAIGQQLTTATHTNQHTVTAGVRWDFHPNMALKFQLDEIRGAKDSAFAFRGTQQNWDGQMRVISLALDFAY